MPISILFLLGLPFMIYLKRCLLIQQIMQNAFYIFFFIFFLQYSNPLKFHWKSILFHSIAHIFYYENLVLRLVIAHWEDISEFPSCFWYSHLTHFLLWNAGIDYLSVAAFDDLIPSHLVFLEGRVRNSVSDKIVILPCFLPSIFLSLPSILVEHNVYISSKFISLAPKIGILFSNCSYSI